MSKQRIQFFDLVSGIFMIRTIWLHIAQLSGFYPNDLLDIVLRVSYFAMPWFFFRSGYFFNLGERSMAQYAMKLSRKLLLPFIIFTIIGFFINLPFELSNTNRELYRIFLSVPYSILRFGSGGIGNLPIWFLLSLFSSLLFFALLTRLRIYKFILLFPIISYFLQLYNIILPLGFSNIFIGIFFIYIGSLYRKYEVFNRYLLGGSIAVFLLIQIFDFSYLDFRTNSLQNGSYISYIISSIAGIIIIFNIGKSINYIKPINYIGKNSIIYFVLHWPVILFVKNIIVNNELNKNQLLIPIFCASIVIIIIPILIHIINNKLPFLIGGEFPKKFSIMEKQWLTLNYKK